MQLHQLFLKGFQEDRGFPGSSTGKESTSNAGDPGLILGSGSPPGEGISYPLQYSWLENPHGQRSLMGYSPWGRKVLKMTEVTKHSHKKGPEVKICLQEVYWGIPWDQYLWGREERLAQRKGWVRAMFSTRQAGKNKAWESPAKWHGGLKDMENGFRSHGIQTDAGISICFLFKGTPYWEWDV